MHEQLTPGAKVCSNALSAAATREFSPVPIESITCRSCGSTDVQVVKPSTYFCNNCESVFRDVASTPVRVPEQTTFCGCGNPVAYRCWRCQTSMCEEHDAYYGLHIGTMSGRYVTVSAGGYSLGVEESLDLVVDGSRRVAQSALTAVMPLEKIVAVAYGTHDGVATLHSCWPCAKDHGEQLAEMLREGTMCAMPYCDGGVAGRCDCCRLAFCDGSVSNFDVRGEPHLAARGEYKVQSPVGLFVVPGQWRLCVNCRRLLPGLPSDDDLYTQRWVAELRPSPGPTGRFARRRWEAGHREAIAREASMAAERLASHATNTMPMARRAEKLSPEAVCVDWSPVSHSHWVERGVP